ncbi:sigma-70 family RNA polymerase sigma factor [Massilia sp. Mn16-1_5]|uniref:sigma-70 family RNA polymerase sigma factor n=1 Tax=Massilia sp. Mn16-1_5 TaxID=2079199 RepID=UPI001E335C28|nr:sigma-70 family RNA polymerase sigma factor [Massilia sp. Mn16-1_5]
MIDDIGSNEQLRQLLGRVGLHDATAFRTLYDSTSAKLFGLAMRILKKEELAEEALQEGYVSIWHAAMDYQAHLAAPMTWMSAIVRNKALDIYRRHVDTVAIDSEQFEDDIASALHDPAPGPLSRIQLSDDARALAYCMSKLDSRQRQTIGIVYYFGLSHSEAALQLDLPIGTIKTWVRRGLEKLKACLTKRVAA